MPISVHTKNHCKIAHKNSIGARSPINKFKKMLPRDQQPVICLSICHDQFDARLFMMF